MKLSARNVLKGTVVDIISGAVLAQVHIDIGGGNVITATITVSGADELGLAPGKEVSAVIKASDVMVATDD